MKRSTLIIILIFSLQGFFYPSSAKNTRKSAHFTYKFHIYNAPVPASSRFNNILLPLTLVIPATPGIFPYNEFNLSRFAYGGNLFHPSLISGNFFEIRADYLLHAGNATVIFPEVYRVQTYSFPLTVSPKD